MIHLPTNIDPASKEAYNWAYGTLYWKQPKDVQFLIGKAKRSPEFTCREVQGFLKEVSRMAEHIPTTQELDEWKREEKKTPPVMPKPVDILGIGIVEFDTKKTN